LLARPIAFSTGDKPTDLTDAGPGR
jgi:hypothetical protein